MKLVKDIKSRMFHFSTIALLLGVALSAAWVVFPADLKARLSPETLDHIAYGLLALMTWGTVGKFIQQPKRVPKE